jgi:hypothetical protein
MSREQIAAMFPNASRSVLEANGAFSVSIPSGSVANPDKVQKLRQGRQPNKTELDFERRLESQKLRGEIVDYKFEGITIRLADNCRYTPDFFIVVSLDPLKLRIAETKGGHIWDDSKVKFRVAKEQNPWAEWEMHQKKAGQWSRIL